MKKGICPKCNPAEIYYAYAKSSLDAGVRADSGQLLLNIHKKTNKLFDEFNLYYLENYLCRDCGYLENYVQDLSELSRLETCSNWQKLPTEI